MRDLTSRQLCILSGLADAGPDGSVLTRDEALAIWRLRWYGNGCLVFTRWHKDLKRNTWHLTLAGEQALANAARSERD